MPPSPFDEANWGHWYHLETKGAKKPVGEGFRKQKIALGVDKTESSINVYMDMKWLPLYPLRHVHLSSNMFKVIKV